MARVWVVVLSVWAMLAIVAVLAWASRPTVSAAPQLAPQQVRRQGPERQVAPRRPQVGRPRDDADLRAAARADEHAVAHRMARRRHELLGGRHHAGPATSAAPAARSPRRRPRSTPARRSCPASTRPATCRV